MTLFPPWSVCCLCFRFDCSKTGHLTAPRSIVCWIHSCRIWRAFCHPSPCLFGTTGWLPLLSPVSSFYCTQSIRFTLTSHSPWTGVSSGLSGYISARAWPCSWAAVCLHYSTTIQGVTITLCSDPTTIYALMPSFCNSRSRVLIETGWLLECRETQRLSRLLLPLSSATILDCRRSLGSE